MDIIDTFNGFISISTHLYKLHRIVWNVSHVGSESTNYLKTPHNIWKQPKSERGESKTSTYLVIWAMDVKK